MAESCDRCGAPRMGRTRYCKGCLKYMLWEMREAGYFTPAPRFTGAWDHYRSQGHREDVRETKYGSER